MKIIKVEKKDWQSLKDIRLESLKDSPEAFAISYDLVKGFSHQEWQSLASECAGPRFSNCLHRR